MPVSQGSLGLASEQFLTAAIDIRARAHDASHVLLYPRAVAVPRDAAEVAALLRECGRAGVGVTFRSGGTSLSGQAGTDAVLADVRRHFDRIEILDDGARVRVEPGVTVNRLNAHLAPYGRKIGPDPASSAACTIGGVVANNSSGMACGTVENSYRTIESLVVVLASGTVIDTGAPDADTRLRVLEPALYEGLLRLRARVLANPASVATITQQFAMKNTMGYGLNSLLDFDTPVGILTHLMIGSEGTLGFIASATFRTVSVRPYVQTALLVFDDLYAANRALPGLVSTGAATLELMDATSLRVGQRLANAPAEVAALQVTSQAALLVEFQSTDPAELAERVAAARPVLDALPLVNPATMTADPGVRSRLWVLRQGLYTSVAAARRPGTTALLEDIVVPVEALAETCTALGGLFEEYAYPDSVIFGHAKDGNIHFMITDRFERELERYERFTDAMVDLVLGHRGSLKAEHGTGRVMAPFVRTQYGDELYAVMREIKRLFDPTGLLNDGVVLTDDPRAHLKHIKTPTPVDPVVDACVECGYCEPVCPARTLTLTPRQRIAVAREIERAGQSGNSGLAEELRRAYVYDGVHTCAVDGMCSVACPVGINTGVYIKGRRAEAASPVAQKGWAVAARHWAGATHVASFALGVAERVGGRSQSEEGGGPDAARQDDSGAEVTATRRLLAPVVTGVTKLGRAVVGADQMPLWTPDLPGGGRSRRRPFPHRTPVAAYIPACVNSMFGPADDRTPPVPPAPPGDAFVAGKLVSDQRNRPAAGPDQRKRPAVDHGAGPGAGVQRAFERLCALAGVALVVPPGIDSLCCGTPWSSKGMTAGYSVMRDRVVPAVRQASDNGRLPIVCDASSCTEGLQKMLSADPGLTVIDAVQFVAEYVLPHLPAITKVPSLTLHETCSSTQIGLNPYLRTIAHAVAEQVNVPVDQGCCAFAGDRGMLHPELTYAATRPEAAEVARLDATVHASCNRTCEIGLTRATGRPYRHILEILAELVSQPGG